MTNIDSNNPNINSAAKSGLRSGAVPTSKTVKGESSSSPAPASGDSVSISTLAKQMEQLEKSVQSAGDVDFEKVAALRNAVEDGTYTVNPKQLARDMLKHDNGF